MDPPETPSMPPRSLLLRRRRILSAITRSEDAPLNPSRQHSHLPGGWPAAAAATLCQPWGNIGGTNTLRPQRGMHNVLKESSGNLYIIQLDGGQGSLQCCQRRSIQLQKEETGPYFAK